MNRQDNLNKIARELGRAEIWREDQEKALLDNIDSDLEIAKQAILDMKVEPIEIPDYER